MSQIPPLVDAESGRIDRTQVLAEAIPLAELVGLVALIALVPYSIAVLLGESILFALLGQFVLAVGSGVVLIYVVSRAMQLASE